MMLTCKVAKTYVAKNKHEISLHESDIVTHRNKSLFEHGEYDPLTGEEPEGFITVTRMTPRPVLTGLFPIEYLQSTIAPKKLEKLEGKENNRR